MISDPFIILGKQLLGSEKPVLLDIGGAAGLQPHWLKFIGNTNLIFFEPHSASYQELLEIYRHSPYFSDMRFISEGLSEFGGSRDFYKTNCPTGSSLYEPDLASMYVVESNPYFFPFTKVQIETKSLQQCLDAEGVEVADGMKLDIQGAELEVIRGLNTARLETCLLIESEVGLANIYKGGTVFTDIKQYLEENNFELFDMKCNRAALRIPGSMEFYHDKYFKVDSHCPAVSSRIYELDVVFFKNPKKLLEQKNLPAIRKLVYFYCIYNFFAEALNLLELGLSTSLFTQGEADQIGQAVADWHTLVRRQLTDLEGKLKQTDNMVWSQYTWVPYPCT